MKRRRRRLGMREGPSDPSGLQPCLGLKLFGKKKQRRRIGIGDKDGGQEEQTSRPKKQNPTRS